VLIAKAKLAQECGGEDASVTVVIKARDILHATGDTAASAAPCPSGKFEDRPYGGEGDYIAVCSVCNRVAGDH
jgi:hypothetical protein